MKKLLTIIGITMALIGCQVEDTAINTTSEDCEAKIMAFDASIANTETGLIEGDIIPDFKTTSKASILLGKQWPEGIVPYQIDGSFYSQEHIDLLTYRMDEIERRTYGKIQFVKDKNSDYGLVFKVGFTGRSSVGNQNRWQDIYIAFERDTNGILRIKPGNAHHEIGHALGLRHEHTRNDRDDYLNMLWENIPEKERDNYAKKGTDCGDYDFTSVMHYKGEVDGIKYFERKDGKEMPDNVVLSDGDIEAIILVNGLE